MSPQDLDGEGNSASGFNAGSGGDDATSAGEHGAFKSSTILGFGVAVVTHCCLQSNQREGKK